MARSVYYYHASGRKTDKYEKEKAQIKIIFAEHKGRYGYRRVMDEMKNRGYTINHKTVKRLMDELGLKSKVRQVKYRSYKGTVGKVAPNVLERNFKADAPNRKWTTDVTQCNIGDKKVYLSPIIDMFNGEVVSYSVSFSPNMQMIDDMQRKAFRKVKRKDTKGLIFQSDQGWHYQHRSYQKALRRRGIIQSMSRKGNCLDNAVAENFFAIMKTELLYAEKFKTTEAFMKALDEYIDYYNNKRIKSRLNKMSPVQYRTHYQYTE